jgi:hypothetical protein
MKLTGHKTESVSRRYAIVAEAGLSEGVAKLAKFHEAQAGANPESDIRPAQRATVGDSRSRLSPVAPPGSARKSATYRLICVSRIIATLRSALQGDPKARRRWCKISRPAPSRNDGQHGRASAHDRETTGQTFELWPSVVPILDIDWDFKAWRQRAQNGPGAGLMMSERGDRGR